jgi:hypothetical protein
MVADYSHNSYRSEKEEIYFQYCHFYYYKHYNEENRKDELLNLTHLFDGGTWIGDEPIKSDRWSSCELTVRKVRNGDFTSRHSWSDSYIASYYAYGNNQWYYEKEKPSDPKYKNISEPIYTDAYFAPVIMASYMEIDDSERSDRFTGNYNGKSFELVHYPTPEQCNGTMAFPWDVTEWFNGLSFLDEKPFNPIPTN